MISKKAKPTTVEEYIQNAPEQAQEKLRELRAILKEGALWMHND